MKEIERLKRDWDLVEFEIQRVLASVGDARGSDLDSWRELCVRVCALSILALLVRLGSEEGRNGRRRQGLKRSVLYLCGYSFSLYSTGDMREKFEIKRILYIIFRIICLLWIETHRTGSVSTFQEFVSGDCEDGRHGPTARVNKYFAN